VVGCWRVPSTRVLSNFMGAAHLRCFLTEIAKRLNSIENALPQSEPWRADPTSSEDGDPIPRTAT